MTLERRRSTPQRRKTKPSKGNCLIDAYYHATSDWDITMRTLLLVGVPLVLVLSSIVLLFIFAGPITAGAITAASTAGGMCVYTKRRATKAGTNPTVVEGTVEGGQNGRPQIGQ
ncbi:hypothetical protein NLX83_01760 [Allokutzneria sp. A3M-2-11 16]|uniref:hypothetical protein n=1 Tax=Allokutzneria sp. A3M-2-11 16 TaxID=2962043 RepID=UPI0020B76CF9|nr:hypothetical protein [Allokutzneria sp. A3M-2-11 16]MCP3797975.1 hypothetical protein [Allokutzneria sp. A3M-2-11 16]